MESASLTFKGSLDSSFLKPGTDFFHPMNVNRPCNFAIADFSEAGRFYLHRFLFTDMLQQHLEKKRRQKKKQLYSK